MLPEDIHVIEFDFGYILKICFLQLISLLVTIYKIFLRFKATSKNYKKHFVNLVLTGGAGWYVLSVGR